MAGVTAQDQGHLEIPLWSPGYRQVHEANLTAFTRKAAQGYDARIQDFPALWAWSVRNPEQFWPAVWEFCGIRASRLWDRPADHLDRMPGAEWFPGARLNFARNLLREEGREDALVFWNEAGRQRAVSWDELREQTARLAAALRSWGVGPGDRVAAVLPNLPETVIAMLASASIGAVFSSCSPDFGEDAVLDRFGQIEPKVLFVADGYRYNGKALALDDRMRTIADKLPGLVRTVLVPYLNPGASAEGLPGGTLWQQCLTAVAALTFEELPFAHPQFILYSSGTTGKPKCIVHTAGGTLLQHQKEHVLHSDIRAGDRVFYFTTCGWMMWNWLVSALACRATVVLYDGSPFAPSGRILFEMAAAERITHFGTSPKFLAALEKHGLAPREFAELAALRVVLSTGSPLPPHSFDFVYQAIKRDVQLSSISGGTDIISCFALGNPVGPVFRGELQTRGLGMAVEVWNDQGQPVIGEKGELVCTRPFPSMPAGFWNDPVGARYRAAYFERFPNVWTHGDFAELTGRGGLIIYGRSDAVLNPGGVRIGTAEIYREVEKLDEVLESICVGQEWDDDVRVVLFVRLKEGVELDEGLVGRIRQTIRAGLSPRHVPARVLAVPDIPRTISGKITEIAVRELIHGRPVKNTDALANPESLRYFADRPELRV